MDLTAPGSPEAVLRLVKRADALVEGFRPGVAEKPGLGPDECLLRAMLVSSAAAPLD